MPTTKVSEFSDLQDTFLSYVRDIKYATMITVDREGRPRARVLLPVWEVVDGRPVGWLASYRTPVKAAHLANNPHTTYSYWNPCQNAVHVDSRSAWADDEASKRHAWDLYIKGGPPGVGYDPVQCRRRRELRRPRRSELVLGVNAWLRTTGTILQLSSRQAPTPAPGTPGAPGAQWMRQTRAPTGTSTPRAPAPRGTGSRTRPPHHQHQERPVSPQVSTLTLTVDPASAVAPFEQVRTQIADRARDGSLPVGYKLPTVRGLAEDLGLAANTVAKAYRALETDGVIETRGRNGSFIAAAGEAADKEAAAAAESYARRAQRLGLDHRAALAAVENALRATYGSDA